MKQTVREKIVNKTAVVGILGLGYVGLPLMLRFVEMSYQVIGFDVDDSKVTALNGGQSYIENIPHSKIKNALELGFIATSDFSRASECDALIICVPTPLNQHREPDLSYVRKTLDSVLPHLRPGQIISLESTTYPGTTEEEILPLVSARDFTVGKDIFVVYSPEREDPGNKNFTTRSIPKICGGVTPSCLEVGSLLYEQVIDVVVKVSSTKTAEMTKLLENIHRAVNIGLVNEMKIVADRMKIDIHEVIRAAATKPFGFVPYYPGPGLGGHCIPIDPFYLTWKAREYGVHTRFIELAGEVNSSMPRYVVEKIQLALNERCKSVKSSKVLILGVAYKKDIDDLRESPSLEIIQELYELGAHVDYSDPHIPDMYFRESEIRLSSVDLTPSTIQSYDCIVIATDHSAFDYELITDWADMIVDTRGTIRGGRNVVKA